MTNKCKECGCSCNKCMINDQDVQLHVEIENLKQRLVEKENHIVMMETNFLNDSSKYPDDEFSALKEELLTWQDKYKRLYEAHRRVQRVNQGLEDKLLKLVDVCETDKNTLTKDVATLSHNLAEANYAIKKLTEDNERYKNDVSLAIQFLQCKQANFVAHRFDSLPSEVQTQVAAYMSNKRKPQEDKNRLPMEPKSIKVPIPTFPPTAMVYSVPKSPKADRRELDNESDYSQVDIVSAAIMAKVLEERQKERAFAKHCDTCTCAKNLKIIHEVSHHHVGTQTGHEYRENVCLKCNEGFSQPLAAVQVLKQQPEAKKTSQYPSVIIPLPLETVQTQNVVKVQPNNFLIEKTLSQSEPSENSPKNAQAPVNLTMDLIDFDDVNIANATERPLTPLNLNQHNKEISLLLDGSPKVSKDVKGPRYASMRVQTGSKNILLDNAQNSVAPVLYTRVNQQNNSSQTAQINLESSRKQNHSFSTTSSEGKRLSLVSENSTQHHQRIDEWVQVTVENDNVSSPETSRSEDLKLDPKKEMEIKLDKARYAEMEENVKRFLFSKSDFWKTVEIGKMKYKKYQDVDRGKGKSLRDGNRTSSHTETEI